MPLDSTTSPTTHTFTHTGGFFGADSPTYWSYSFDDWNFSSDGSTDWSWDWGNQDDDWVTASFYFNGSYDMAFGIAGEARVDLGSIESEINVTTNAEAVNGGVSTAAAEVEAGVTINAPDPEQTYIDIDLIARMEASISAGVNFWAWGWGEENASFIDESFGFDLSGDLIDITLQDVLDSLDARKMLEIDLGFGALQFGFPTFEYEDAETDSDGVTTITGATNNFLNVEVDLDDFTGLPLGFEYDDSLLGVIFPNIDIGFFDAKLNVGMSFEQELTYTPETSVTMVSSGGETLIGDLGEDFLFEEGKQEGEGSFTVTATYDADIDVNMITNLVVGAAIDWRAFYANVTVAIDVPAIWDNLDDPWGFEFTLAEGSIDLGLDLSFEISNQTWTIDGDSWTEVFTVTYENDRTVASGLDFALTTNQVKAAGNARANTITGNIHDNVMNGRAGKDILHGQGGEDILIGGAGNDALYGGGGDDRLSGGLGIDLLFGGDGSDYVRYTSATAGLRIDLSDPSNNSGEAAFDLLSSIENIIGSAFDDTLIGDQGDNVLFGRGGVNTLIGGGGNDTYDWDWDYVRSMGDTIVESAGGGIDTVVLHEVFAGVLWDNIENVILANSATYLQNIQGNALNNVMLGNASSNILSGNDGDDLLRGSGGTDNLFGGNGTDSLRGGAGDDALYGGNGADVLSGGVGADSFWFTTPGTSEAGSPDVIADFNSYDGDRIWFNMSEVTHRAAYINGEAGALTVTAEGSDCRIRVDSDGDYDVDYEILVLGVTTLAIDDILLVNDLIG